MASIPRRRPWQVTALPALVVASALVLSACGTRVSDAEVVAGSGGGPARIEPSVLEQLRSSGTVGDTAGGTGEEAGALPLTEGPIAADGEGAAGETLPDSPAAGAADPGAAAGGADPAAAGATGNAKSATTPKKQTGKASDAQRAAGAQAPAQSPGKAAAGGGADAPCTEQGAPVALGQVGGFSGVSGPITASARTAMAVWAKDVNARGGLACHPVMLFAADDGSDPARSAAVVQDLAQTKNVQAIVGAFSALSMAGLVSGAEKTGLPVVGGDLLDVSWNQHPNLFPQGPGVVSIIRGALEQTIASGKTKLGLLYCVESSVCTTAAKIIPEETAKAGGELAYSSAVSLTQTDFTAQCQNAKNKGVQALGMAVDGATTGRVARSCAALGYFPQFVASALTLSPKQAEDPNVRKNTISTSNPNAPFTRSDTPGQREYQAAMKRFAPGTELSGTSIAAWASGKLLEAAIAGLGAEARGKPITTEMIYKGLGTIKDETLDGLSPEITFTAGQKAAPAINCSFFALLTPEGWSSSSSKPVCAGAEKGGSAAQVEAASALPSAVAPALTTARRTTATRRD